MDIFGKTAVITNKLHSHYGCTGRVLKCLTRPPFAATGEYYRIYSDGISGGAVDFPWGAETVVHENEIVVLS